MGSWSQAVKLQMGGDETGMNGADAPSLLVLLCVCVLTIRVVRVKPYIEPGGRGQREMILGLGLEEKIGSFPFPYNPAQCLMDDSR